MTSGQGRVPATAPEKWLTSGPGPPSAAAPSTRAAMSSRSSSSSAIAFIGLALADEDRRLDPGFLDDRAGGLEHHRLGAQPGLLLHRRLDAAPLDEFGGRDDGEQDRPRRRSAPRDARRSASAARASLVSSITTRYDRIALPRFGADAAPDRAGRASARSFDARGAASGQA